MDNTVGSLTKFQRSVITGSILGDGYLRIIPGRKNAFLEIIHSYKAKKYVDWKFRVLQNICRSKPKKKKGNGNRIAYRFFTRQHPELTEIYCNFYKNKKKKIPQKFELNAVVLSIWFMDDGSKCSDSDFYLNTQQFSKEEQELLIEKLKKLKLNSSLNRDKKYYRIRFKVDSLKQLKKLIGKHLIPSMKYKIS